MAGFAALVEDNNVPAGHLSLRPAGAIVPEQSRASALLLRLCETRGTKDANVERITTRDLLK